MPPSFKNMEIVDGILPFTERQQFFIKKGFPWMGAWTVVLGLLMCVAAIVVLVIEQDHATVSSVSYYWPPVVVIVAGVVTLLAGIFAFCMTKCKPITRASIKKRTCAFIVVMALAAVLSLVGTAMGFIYAGKVEDKMEGDMKNKLQEYGLTGRYKSLTIINDIQSKGECCGVINYVDWRNTTYGGHRYDKVPDSCCKQEQHACGFEFEFSKINRKGCLEIVRSSAAFHLRLIGILGIFFLLLELVLAVFAFLVRKKHFA